MENSFRTIIQNANSIVIFLPTKPYFDQVASALAMYLALKETKPVQVVSAAPMTVSFNRLISVDEISESTGNKNLVIGFSNYDANGIERVSYDIVDNQFKLTVIPKSGINAPKEEQVKVTYEGVAADTVILFGGATDAHFPQLATKGLESAKTYHIGTRPLTVDPSKVIFTFAQPMASVSELTFLLINEAQLTIGADTATNLLMGIEDATQNYKSASVTPDTFEITGSLMRMGGKRMSAATIDASKFPVGAIPQIPVRNATDESLQEQMPVSPADFADFSQNQPKDTLQGDVIKESIPVPMTMDQQQIKEDVEDALNPPEEWLQQPKVYKGTSLN